MATLLKVDGSEAEVMPMNGDTFGLAELQGFVGGFIEPVRLPNGKTMYVNEDGKLLKLPRNERATLLLHVAGGLFTDYVVGDVVIVSPAEH